MNSISCSFQLCLLVFLHFFTLSVCRLSLPDKKLSRQKYCVQSLWINIYVACYKSFSLNSLSFFIVSLQQTTKISVNASLAFYFTGVAKQKAFCFTCTHRSKIDQTTTWIMIVLAPSLYDSLHNTTYKLILIWLQHEKRRCCFGKVNCVNAIRYVWKYIFNIISITSVLTSKSYMDLVLSKALSDQEALPKM